MRAPTAGSFLLALFVLSLGAPPARAAAGDDPYASLQWGYRTVRADVAARASDGGDVVVAVVDTGVDATHPDLRGAVLAGVDLVDRDDDASDRNGHGTLVAGIIAAASGNGVGVAGVAPGARILPVRVLDEDGRGSSRDVAEGIRWAIERGAAVINLALAHETDRRVPNLLDDPSVDRAIREAAEAGATVVIAAGNDPDGGRDETAYDADVPGVLVVGASTRDDRRAAYSNHGPGLDLVAPGGGSATDPSDAACGQRSGIVSTWWNPRTERAGYGAGCGTSMAVAFVSATAALLHARGATNVGASSRIVATARDVGAPGADIETGAGRLDVARALGVRARATPPRPQPEVPVRVQGVRAHRPIVAAPGPSRVPRAPRGPSWVPPQAIEVSPDLPSRAAAPGGGWLVSLASFSICALAFGHAARIVLSRPRSARR